MAQFCRKHITEFLGVAFLLLGALFVLNHAFFIAFLVLIIFGAGTALIFLKSGIKEKEFFILFLVVLLVYFASTALIHYTHFYPFGGGEGDQRQYHSAAVEMANDFRQGDFSFSNIGVRLAENQSLHIYPVFLAVLYSVTMPEQIIGKMLGVWLTALSALVLYMLAKELGASKKWAFGIGLSAALYPSYLYFGSLLLRESLVALLVILSTLLLIKLLKQFSLVKFLLFFYTLFGLTHFRFYFGAIILFAFVLCWFLLSNLKRKERILYGVLMIPLFGFIPQILGHSYFGLKEVSYFTKPSTIVAYREFVASPPVHSLSSEVSSVFPASESKPGPDLGSTFVLKTDAEHPILFVRNYLLSFLSVALGPFPWQIRYARQLFVLLEMIPWWGIVFFLVKGVARVRSRWKSMLPILLVSAGILAEIALEINNYGTYMRIRIPAFLLLLSLLPFTFQNDMKKA